MRPSSTGKSAWKLERPFGLSKRVSRACMPGTAISGRLMKESTTQRLGFSSRLTVSEWGGFAAGGAMLRGVVALRGCTTIVGFACGFIPAAATASFHQEAFSEGPAASLSGRRGARRGRHGSGCPRVVMAHPNMDVDGKGTVVVCTGANAAACLDNEITHIFPGWAVLRTELSRA